VAATTTPTLHPNRLLPRPSPTRPTLKRRGPRHGRRPMTCHWMSSVMLPVVVMGVSTVQWDGWECACVRSRGGGHHGLGDDRCGAGRPDWVGMDASMLVVVKGRRLCRCVRNRYVAMAMARVLDRTCSREGCAWKRAVRGLHIFRTDASLQGGGAARTGRHRKVPHRGT